MKINGRVQMSLGHGPEGSRWHLRVLDEGSGTVLLEVRMTPEQFGLAVGAMSCAGVEVDLTDPEILARCAGKIRETKRERVPLGDAWGSEALAVVREGAASFEVDGWKASHDRTFNHHRVHGRAYEVIFARYVEAPGE